MSKKNQLNKKPNVKIVLSLVIISLISILIFTAVPVSACHYTVDTFESDYITPKDSFFKGEVVYGQGNAYGYDYLMKLRIRDPNGNIVYYSGESKYVVYGNYTLNATAQPGVWNIQLGIFEDDCWQWLTSSGRIAYFTVNDNNYCENGEKPCALTMQYTGEDCSASNHHQDPKKVSCNGDPASESPVHILVTDKENPFDEKAKIWFDGLVNLNEAFEINAINAWNTKLKPTTYVYIFNATDDTLLQSIKFHTSCSQPLFEGDQFGSLKLINFIPESKCDCEYELIISIDGNGDVDVDPEQDTYTYGQIVNLTAIPNSGYSFSHWSGDLDSSDNPESIFMDSNKVVTAHFTQDQYELIISIDGNGDVDVDPEQDTYTYGQIVNLTAIPDSGYSFSHWSGDLDSSDNPESIFMDSDKTVTANFIQDKYNLTITIDGNGNVSKDPDQENYTYVTIVNITATANSGWEFDHWSGSLSGDNISEEINITSHKEITAHFKELEDNGGGTSGNNGGSRPRPPVEINNDPVAIAGGPYFGVIDEMIKFDGSNSYDLDNDIESYIWDFGDGTTGEGKTVKHNYSLVGVHTILLEVIDSKGANNFNETVAIIVQPNHPPSIPNITGPSEGLTDIIYSFSIVSYDEDNDTIMYTIDWGDGNIFLSDFLPSGNSFNVIHKWTKTGNFKITISADDNETVSTDEMTITIDEPDIIEEDNFILILLLLLALLLLLLFGILAKRRKDNKEENKKKK